MKKTLVTLGLLTAAMTLSITAAAADHKLTRLHALEVNNGDDAAHDRRELGQTKLLQIRAC